MDSMMDTRQTRSTSIDQQFSATEFASRASLTPSTGAADAEAHTGAPHIEAKRNFNNINNNNNMQRKPQDRIIRKRHNYDDSEKTEKYQGAIALLDLVEKPGEDTRQQHNSPDTGAAAAAAAEAAAAAGSSNVKEEESRKDNSKQDDNNNTESKLDVVKNQNAAESTSKQASSSATPTATSGNGGPSQQPQQKNSRPTIANLVSSGMSSAMFPQDQNSPYPVAPPSSHLLQAHSLNGNTGQAVNSSTSQDRPSSNAQVPIHPSLNSYDQRSYAAPSQQQQQQQPQPSHQWQQPQQQQQQQQQGYYPPIHPQLQGGGGFQAVGQQQSSRPVMQQGYQPTYYGYAQQAQVPSQNGPQNGYDQHTAAYAYNHVANMQNKPMQDGAKGADGSNGLLPLRQADGGFSNGQKDPGQDETPISTISSRQLPANVKDSSSRPFSCPFQGCKWTFARHSDQRRHLRSHYTPAFQCPYWRSDPTCHRNGGAFNRLDVLKRHLRLVHFIQLKESESGWCRVCQQMFANPREFVGHCHKCAEQVRPAEWRLTDGAKQEGNTNNGNVNGSPHSGHSVPITQQAGQPSQMIGNPIAPHNKG